MSEPGIVVETSNRSLIVRIVRPTCLYGPSAQGVLATLTSVAERCHQPSPPEDGVLVLQESPQNDVDDPELLRSMESCLLDEAARAFDDLRWALHLIRNAPVPWIYAAASDSLGSSFELALSCRKRLWFAPEARLGFPAIAAGFFPPGGAIEAITKKAGKTRDTWQNKPLLTAAEARAEGLVDFSTRAADWREAARSMFAVLNEERAQAGGISPQRAPRIDFSTPRDAEARQNAFENLEFVAKWQKAHAVQPRTAWEICWELVKERQKLKDPRDLGRLVAYICARHVLAPEFHAWTASQRAFRCARRSAFVNARPVARLVVDLDCLAPPTEVLARIMRASTQIVFICGDAEALAVALNLVYSRLERHLGAETAFAFWERHVSWACAPAAAVGAPLLRFTVDDRVQIVDGGESQWFLRLAGNAGGAAAGILEWSIADRKAELPPLVLAVARLVSDGIMQSPASKVPRSVHIRSLFLEEMIRVARHMDGDLAAAADALHAKGWTFAGSDEAWDRFLHTRRDTYRLLPALGGVGASELDRVNWEIGSFKHARAVAKKGGSAGKTRWNPTAVSQHMALFLGLVVDVVAASASAAAGGGAGTDLGEIDAFCALALGFPTELGSPRHFLERRGLRRVEYDVARHWPAFPIRHAWSESRV